MWRSVAIMALGTWLAWTPSTRAAPAGPPAGAMGLRLFPELTAFLADPGGGARFDKRPEMVLLKRARLDRLRNSIGCAPMPDCALAAIEITPQDSATIRIALSAAHAPPGVLDAWGRDAAAIDKIIEIYGQGKSPRYPRIDSMAHDARSEEFVRFVGQLRRDRLSAPLNTIEIPWDAIDTAIALLDADDRLDALRFAPLWKTENGGAVRRARRLDWRAYPYSAILVPGEGPEQPDEPLSPLAKLRLAHAVQIFETGQAPFLIVSGGSVHPAHTRFIEAYEMRRRLIALYHVPRDRIVLEPYARHTTTNLRNAARALDILRSPAGKPVLIVTDDDQKHYIESPAFRARSLRELGYAPGEIGPAPTAFSLAFHPSPACRKIDPSDPMDP
ncbi:YdcF family protein [Nguyenibacter vanlangensis]|uniref:YdcF family protein n=1 Tax=Nguyenibacter vanlangensis TaxID=1216886 RepID=A0A7Y7IUS0_9PROT|nr:YdcF family protein [Nguyenibacter vanlangensis]NVN10714.1 YdcF family protein [Nguyenibacter vanlangensis]